MITPGGCQRITPGGCQHILSYLVDDECQPITPGGSQQVSHLVNVNISHLVDVNLSYLVDINISYHTWWMMNVNLSYLVDVKADDVHVSDTSLDSCKCSATLIMFYKVFHDTRRHTC